MPTGYFLGAKTKFDLTESADQQSLYALADRLVDLRVPTDEIADAARRDDAPLEFKIAAKLVDSRRFLRYNKRPLKLGVVFAMWGEQNRLRPKSPDNPNGEDALRVKLEQLAWATKDTPMSWTLYAVDDGDPNDSGSLAAQIAADHPLGDKVKVLWLDKALPAAAGPLKNLASAGSDLDLLINHLPLALATATDKDLGNPIVMTPEAMQAWIRQRKAEEARARG